MSKLSYFVTVAIGFAAGAIVVSVIPNAKESGPAKGPALLTLVAVDSPLWREASPHSDLYALKWRGQDVAGVEVGRDAIKSIIIMDFPGHRQLSLQSRDGKLIGNIHLDKMSPKDPYESLQTLADDDADGIPDKRVDWELTPKHRATTFTRETITWTRQLLKSSGTAPATKPDR